jgi:hypothetical protein
VTGPSDFGSGSDCDIAKHLASTSERGSANPPPSAAKQAALSKRPRSSPHQLPGSRSRASPRGEGSSTTAWQGARRCAIYTRKSTEEGLEQAFNPLHAQREACEAYIVSQRHEGWAVLYTFDTVSIDDRTENRTSSHSRNACGKGLNVG